MSARPGRIVADFAVPFAYPRRPELRFEPEFAELTGRSRRPAVGELTGASMADPTLPATGDHRPGAITPSRASGARRRRPGSPPGVASVFGRSCFVRDHRPTGTSLAAAARAPQVPQPRRRDRREGLIDSEFAATSGGAPAGRPASPSRAWRSRSCSGCLLGILMFRFRVARAVDLPVPRRRSRACRSSPSCRSSASGSASGPSVSSA